MASRHTDACNVPKEVSDVLREEVGRESAKDMLDTAGTIFMSAEAFLPSMSAKTVGDMYTSSVSNRSMNRMLTQMSNWPNVNLTFPMIDAMMKCGQVVFGLGMKKAPIENLFRKEGALSIHIGDAPAKFARAVHENITTVVGKYIGDFMTMLEYGVSINEVVWNIQDGIAVVDEINSVNPRTVDCILLTDKGNFNGFQQKVGGHTVSIPAEQSLLLTYHKQFRSLWGISILTPVYPFYFWYDVVWRAFVRHLERTGTPVVVASAPSRLKVIGKDGSSMDAMVVAEQLAYKVGRSPAIAIPSDRDADGNPLWSLSYLKGDTNGEQFESALSLLGVMILRSLLLPEYVVSHVAGGAYNIGQVHYQMLMYENSRTVNELISQLNRYLCPKYAQFTFGSADAVQVSIQYSLLDVGEKEWLIDILKTAINSKLDVVNRIDYRKIGQIGNIPFVTEDEVEQLRGSGVKVEERDEDR